ncbi:DUF6894 family protein [Bradyrhizobium australiense]|uniref:DUF6894 domain-containing protein n=1 Tax=Bradyrhizobium australiense TaxID=2721161 RepID=A0A7Y4GW88_9BRAD|nr:hypothetical protein [Bradyrhizobium australiense]NOJ43031.1 hypothetical protein [Bradyrhizobium australiense]
MELHSGPMTRYHFDVRHPDGLTLDEEGMELPSAEDAWVEAAHAVAELAVDALPDRAEHGSNHQMEVEVRDNGGAVLLVKVSFEARRLRLDA